MCISMSPSRASATIGTVVSHAASRTNFEPATFPNLYLPNGIHEPFVLRHVQWVLVVKLLALKCKGGENKRLNVKLS
jgi:hypothetical protein